MDFLDPLDAPGVGTPCPGGVTYREGHLAMEMIADSGCMCSFEVIEVNPILDTANTTSETSGRAGLVGLWQAHFSKDCSDGRLKEAARGCGGHGSYAF